MSVSTHQSSCGSSLPMCVIYTQQTPEQAKDVLLAARSARTGIEERLWLLRESRIPGFLTLSWLGAADPEATSIRCGIFEQPDKEFLARPLVDDEMKKISEGFPLSGGFVYANSRKARRDEKVRKAVAAFFVRLAEEGFSADMYVLPTRSQESRNQMYYLPSVVQELEHAGDINDEAAQDLQRVIEQSEAFLAKECPLGFESLQNMEAVAILPSGHPCAVPPLREWIGSHATDPMTNEYLDRDELIVSEGPKKLREALAQASLLLASKSKPPV